MSPVTMVTTVGRREAERAVRAWLDEMHLTMEELRAEAAEGDFRSEEAELAWFLISSLDLD